MKDFFDKLLDKFMQAASTKSITALKDGFVLTMPITLIGSLFLLIANLPFSNYAGSVSYTHLDVYKRQIMNIAMRCFCLIRTRCWRSGSQAR